MRKYEHNYSQKSRSIHYNTYVYVSVIISLTYALAHRYICSMDERYDDKDWVRWQFFAQLERSDLTTGDVAEEMGWDRDTGQSKISKFKHGGGWSRGSKRAYRKQIEGWIAKRGEITASPSTPSNQRRNKQPGIPKADAEKFLLDVRGQVQQLLVDLDNKSLPPERRIDRVQNFACTWYVAVKLSVMIEQQDE